MTSDSPHGELVDRFGEYYASAGASPLRELERRVFGSDYGGNGYTSIDAADQLADLLRLQASSVLLDIGTGAGWPGLYLAQKSGCRVVLTDMPKEGLPVAQGRAAEDGIDGHAVNADGQYLPFRKASFDAVTHADVLC